jgi:hypothetical protein
MNFREYVEAGWALCQFDPGTKGPSGERAKGWNLRERAITDPQRVNGMVQGGLLHAYSNTCSIDVDNLTEARKFFAAHGIDLDALLQAPDAVQISSGRPNRAKLLYRLPTPLVSKKLGRYESLIDGKKYHAVELRCAARNGASVQDVLPPSVHPDTGRPYEWRYGNDLVGSWRNLPEIPPKLLALWQEGHHEAHEDLVGAPAASEAEPAEASNAELRHYLEHHDPDGPYDDWVAVGMALHDATQGSPEGLILWDEWSRRGKKYGESKDGQAPQYPTEKWRSFTPGHGYTIGYLKSKAPPYLAPDAFPIAPVEEEFKAPAAAPGEPDRGVDVRPGAIIRRALSPLVFVSSQGLYYDTTRRTYLNMQSVDHLYSPTMPIVHITGNNGSVKTHQPKPTEELRRASWKEVVHGIGLYPGGERYFTDDGLRFLNSYEGMTETLVPTAHEREAFEAMWSRPDEAVFRDWLLKFFAHAVQKPQIKIGLAPLIVGHATGSGKNTLMEVLPRLLFGNRHFTTMTSATLKSDFSDKLADAWWIYFSELHSGSTKGERISLIKKVEPWITDKFIEVHPKGGKPYDIRNRVQVTGSSNFEDDAIFVNEADRRWVVGHIDKSLSDVEAKDIYDFLDSPRAPAVLRHIFQEVSLADFNPRGRAPETAAKRVMVQVNYGHWESTILELIASGSPPFDKDLFEVKDILPYVKQGGITPARLGRIVSRPPFNFVQYQTAYGNRLWCWRNVKFWNNCSFKSRQDYYTGVDVRPHGWPWSDQLPPALAEACGMPLTEAESLI